jgi:poly(3-hydroxyalkanoate) synthetase
MAANKIDQLLIVSNFNKNWYLGVFWNVEFVGNDEICIQGDFYEATIFKMAANKIVKLSMVSDFNENLYLGVFWSEELVGALNSDMGVVWGFFCVCIQAQSNLVIIIFIIIIPLLLLAAIFSDQILRDWWSDLY